MTAAPSVAPPLAPSLASRSRSVLEQAGMLLVLAALIGFFAFTVDNFFSIDNLSSLLQAVSVVGIISCTMLFCLASGNFDLSVGTITPCAGVVAALMLKKTGSIPIAFSAGLAMGATVGFVNGFVVAKCKINPLITTLATMQIVKGIAFKIVDGKSVPIGSDAFIKIGTTAFPRVLDAQGIVVFQMTTAVWVSIACFLFFGLLLQWTTFGRNTLAIGGNEEAARLAGIKVDRTKIIIFTMQGAIAALAGILAAALQRSGQPKSFEGLELQVIAACVLGGVSLTGGIGKMSYVIAGVFIMGVLSNAMKLKRLDYFDEYIVTGCVLGAAVMYDRFKLFPPSLPIKAITAAVVGLVGFAASAPSFFLFDATVPVPLIAAAPLLLMSLLALAWGVQSLRGRLKYLGAVGVVLATTILAHALFLLYLDYLLRMAAKEMQI